MGDAAIRVLPPLDWACPVGQPAGLVRATLPTGPRVQQPPLCLRRHGGSSVIAMKESLELSIAMKELADNKLTMNSVHDIACRIIESMREDLRTATFANIGD